MTIPQSPNTIYIRYGEKVLAATGEPLTIVIRPPGCVIDAHCHIENGACVPLPLVYNQLPVKLHLDREMVNALVTLIKKEAGLMQVKSTVEIGTCAVNEMNATFGNNSDLAKTDYYKFTDVFTIQILQMMDMEYACIDGFYGETIYREDATEKHWYYWERQCAFEQGKKVVLPNENMMTFNKWHVQLSDTKDAIKAHALQLMGMYHYDPRRWNSSKDTPTEKNLKKGAWCQPFSEIATTYKKGLFLGFKLYPPLGYKPLDERLPYMWDSSPDGDCFYARCEREGIPILVHCSPGGLSTHEAALYMELDGWVKERYSGDPVIRATEKQNYNEGRYFWANYVHPSAWRDVLSRFPKLKLCLAHFGGNEWLNGLSSSWIQEILALTREFKHVYTDFSCWDLPAYKDHFITLLTDPENKHIIDKLLFGTDWYLTLVALEKKSHKSFCEEFFECIMNLKDGMAIWEKLTFVNPFTFYGLHDLKMIGNVAELCRKSGGNKKDIISNLNKFSCFHKKYSDALAAKKSDAWDSLG